MESKEYYRAKLQDELGVDIIWAKQGRITIKELVDTVYALASKEWDDGYDQGFAHGYEDAESEVYNDGYQAGVESMTKDGYGSYPEF